jgi:hypothetical protein
MQQRMSSETKEISKKTKDYIAMVGGNLKGGYCYSKQA